MVILIMIIIQNVIFIINKIISQKTNRLKQDNEKM